MTQPTKYPANEEYLYLAHVWRHLFDSGAWKYAQFCPFGTLAFQIALCIIADSAALAGSHPVAKQAALMLLSHRDLLTIALKYKATLVTETNPKDRRDLSKAARIRELAFPIEASLACLPVDYDPIWVQVLEKSLPWYRQMGRIDMRVVDALFSYVEP